ncbi:MAG: hypothetical protein JWM57_569 [Phycisphaerales bacterium]|nr:hypothetical protein [Phycisphaerales bacterium]
MTSDAIVTPDVMRDAENIVGQMDSSAAIAWLRQCEDTLAMWIHRQCSAALHHLEMQHHLMLPPAVQSVITRAVANTAVTAVAALQSAHHSLWLDLVAGTSMASIDPLLAVRRRVTVAAMQAKQPAKLSKKQRAEVKTEGLAVEKFAFLSCVRAIQKVGHHRVPTLLLSSVGPKGAVRHEMLDRESAERIMFALVSALSQLGCASAMAAWTAVCGQDPFAESPETPPQGGDDDAQHDGEGEVGV